MWQLTFVAGPTTIQDLQNSLQLDEQVLRFVFLKQPQRPSLPSTFAVSSQASQNLASALGAAEEAAEDEQEEAAA